MPQAEALEYDWPTELAIHVRIQPRGDSSDPFVGAAKVTRAARKLNVGHRLPDDGVPSASVATSIAELFDIS